MMRHTARRFGSILFLAAACAVSGCGGDSATSPTATTTTATFVTETFSGSIGQNGVAVHAFTVTTSGYTLLAGYTSIDPGSVTALGIGLGSWDATTSTCSLNLTQNDSGRSGSTAISGTANAGSYCVRVYDGANIGAGVTASYSAQVQHY
jgi:hypothetical protein